MNTTRFCEAACTVDRENGEGKLCAAECVKRVLEEGSVMIIEEVGTTGSSPETRAEAVRLKAASDKRVAVNCALYMVDQVARNKKDPKPYTRFDPDYMKQELLHIHEGLTSRSQAS